MTKKLPAVTIGIPFYNAEATLLDAVRSVFAQTHQDWELILLDDGSTDRSLELAHSIRDPRVKVYSDGRNRRLAARLNQITHLASYDFIARMDADDLMSSDRIEKLLSFLISNERYDLVSCGVYSISAATTLAGFRGNYETFYTFNGLLRKSQKFLHAGLIARKSWYERNKYDESLSVGQDSYLWLGAVKAGDFNAASLDAPLYMYREEENITKKKLLLAYSLERTKISPLIDNFFDRRIYIAKSMVKSLIVSTIPISLLSSYLIRKRNPYHYNTSVDQEFRKTLDKIVNTKIPGVDLA